MTFEDVRYYMMLDHQNANDLISEVINSGIDVSRELVEKIVSSLMKHIYLEENILFPGLPDDLTSDVEYLEREHGEIFRLLRKIKHEDGSESVRNMLSGLLKILIEHNSFEESFIYDSFQTMDSVILKNAHIPSEDWRCKFEEQ